MVDLPLWKIWFRQVGWWNSQLNGKIKFMFHTTKQINNHPIIIPSQPAALMQMMVGTQSKAPLTLAKERWQRHLGVSIHGGTPKWMVYLLKNIKNWWFRGTPNSGNFHFLREVAVLTFRWLQICHQDCRLQSQNTWLNREVSTPPKNGYSVAGRENWTKNMETT